MTLIRTHSDFLNKLEIKYGNTIEALDEWTGTTNEIDFKCNGCESIITRTPKSVLRKDAPSSPCMYCRTKSDYDRRYLNLIQLIKGTSLKLLSKRDDYTLYENRDLLFLCRTCDREFVTSHRSIYRYEMKQCGTCENRKSLLTTPDEIETFIKNNSDSELVDGYRESETDRITIGCDCGRVFKTTWQSAKNKLKLRCGVCTRSISKPEYIASRVLDSKGIEYEEEYSYKELGRLRFDFAIKNKGEVVMLLELDGAQHFKPVPIWGGQERYERQVYRDGLKDQYCLDNDIPLVRIPYTEFDNIEQIISETILI